MNHAANRKSIGPEPGTPDELRAVLEFACAQIPGTHQLNLHAIYLDTDETPDDNLTRSHPGKGIRNFWIEHGRRTREIAKKIGKGLGSSAVNNIWVSNEYKDIPVDRMAARIRLSSCRRNRA